MTDLAEQIEQARVKVGQCRIKAERAGARLEDAFALEKARNRLLTLELRLLTLRAGQTRQRPAASPAARAGRVERTKQEQIQQSPRERAEAAFARLQTDRPAGNRLPGKERGQ